MGVPSSGITTVIESSVDSALIVVPRLRGISFRLVVDEDCAWVVRYRRVNWYLTQPWFSAWRPLDISDRWFKYLRVDSAKRGAHSREMLPPAEKKEPPLIGIFKIDGDTLTICCIMDTKETRPTKFESTKETKTMMLTFKRAKK